MSCCRLGPNSGCCGESWCACPPDENELGHCCLVMERFVGGGGCVPTLRNGIIEACDDAFDADVGGEPIRFCPRCGKELAT